MAARTIDQVLGEYRGPLSRQDWQPRTRDLRNVPGSQIRVIAHHSVGLTLGGIEAEFKSDDRTLSANAGIGPLTPGGTYTSRQYVPWRTGRAYTTSSEWDDTSITFEMADLRLEYPWPIGTTGLNLFAELVAAAHIELDMPIDTAHVVDHLYVFQNGPGSYATQCAGDFMRARIRDYVIPMAREIVAKNNAPTPPPEEDMTVEDLYTGFKMTPSQEVKAGDPAGYLYIGNNKYVSVANGGKAGLQVDGNLHIQVTGGTPWASAFSLTPVVYSKDAKTGKTTETSLGGQEIIFTSGSTSAKVPVNCRLAPGQLLRFRIASPVDLKVSNAAFRGQGIS